MQRRTFLGAVAGLFGLSIPVKRKPESRVHRKGLTRIKLGLIKSSHPSFFIGEMFEWSNDQLEKKPQWIVVSQPDDKGIHTLIMGHARYVILLDREGPDYEIFARVLPFTEREYNLYRIRKNVTSRSSSKETTFG
jgi:hypothetical protein